MQDAISASSSSTSRRNAAATEIDWWLLTGDVRHMLTSGREAGIAAAARALLLAVGLFDFKLMSVEP